MPRPANVLYPGAVAVVTGAASGIGLAASHFFAKRGMNVFMVDISPQLEQSVKQVLEHSTEASRTPTSEGKEISIQGMRVDVSKIDEVINMREKVFDEYGEVHVLMNNAGIGGSTPAFSTTIGLDELQNSWKKVLETNLWGIINVAQAFAPLMSTQENHSVIINTGSKQGITCPPGNAGYNVSKAGVKVFTEQLAHELRNTASGECSAHLFVPGWVHTGLTGANNNASKPPGAWTPEQTVEYMAEKVFDEGDFYVICPDHETASALDKLRIQWSLGDIIENRPALSRWHPEYQAKFEGFIASKQGLGARSRSRGRPMERDSSPAPALYGEPVIPE